MWLVRFDAFVYSFGVVRVFESAGIKLPVLTAPFACFFSLVPVASHIVYDIGNPRISPVRLTGCAEGMAIHRHERGM